MGPLAHAAYIAPLGLVTTLSLATVLAPTRHPPGMPPMPPMIFHAEINNHRTRHTSFGSHRIGGIGGIQWGWGKNAGSVRNGSLQLIKRVRSSTMLSNRLLATKFETCGTSPNMFP
jgi:hypothetical protein